VAGGYAYRASRPAPASQAGLENSEAGLLPAVPFEGRYQAGILPAPQRQTAVISFNVTAEGRGELTGLFQAITARARFLTAGGTPPPVGIGGPPSDSGVLGPTVVPDGLTVTVGVGSTLFDDRYELADRLPAGLMPMLPFPDDDLDPAQTGGDLVLQLSAGNADAVMHALRDIARHTRGGMAAVWRIDGFTSPARPSGTVPRNMLGFMDGIANPDDSHSSTDTNPVGVVTGQNIGDLLNARNITWGWFEGGFAPTGTSNGDAVCGSEHENIGGNEVADYVPHHNPFEYYASTANPAHLAPSSERAVGHTDRANHEYDLSWFYKTLHDGNLPSVSFLKAAAYQDAHPGYSDPIDEQNFLINTINQIEESRFWSSTAIVITYDDSDGWYDHVASPIVNGSNTAADTAMCSSVAATLGSFQYRCGYGPRLPLLVISPWTRDNYVSNNLTDQASVVRFIEDNWLRGKRLGNGSNDASSGSLYAPGGVLDFHVRPHFTPLILNPSTGEPIPSFG
jgi:hypothetical protein